VEAYQTWLQVWDVSNTDFLEFVFSQNGNVKRTTFAAVLVLADGWYRVSMPEGSLSSGTAPIQQARPVAVLHQLAGTQTVYDGSHSGRAAV
jgi:hypothetical protein